MTTAVPAICPLPVVSVRARPDHRAALVTQVLFGERLSVQADNGKGWSKVRCVPGTTTGWMPRAHWQPAPEEAADYAYSLEMLQPALGDTVINLPFGARLPHYDGLRFRLGEQAYNFSGQAVAPDLLDPYAELVIKLARRFLNAPYLPGGRTIFGIDGVGLWQLVFRLVGIELPRSLTTLARRGADAGFLQQALPGDLAFFTDPDDKLVHTGLLLPEEQLLHVTDRVRIDRLDHRTIRTETQEVLPYRLRVIRRLLPDLPKYRRGSGPRRGRGGKQFELF